MKTEELIKIIIDDKKGYVSIKYYDTFKEKKYKFTFFKYNRIKDLLKTEFLEEIEKIIKNPKYKKSEVD